MCYTAGFSWSPPGIIITTIARTIVHDAGRFSKLLLDFRKDARRYLPDGLFYCL